MDMRDGGRGEESPRRIVLIGGAGFVGHHLALRMAAEGWETVVVDDLNINHIGRIAAAPDTPARRAALDVLQRRMVLLRDAGIPVCAVDARDRRRLAHAVGDTRGSVVVHLAGVAHADRSDREPHEAFEHTLGSLATTLDVVRGGVRRLVYFSSSMVYGDFNASSIDEEHPLRPIGVYGALKLAGEALVRAHHRVSGLSYTVVRPSALYGPRCVSGRVTQQFIERAALGMPLRVEGDGADRVDFTYIDDLVEGIRLTLVCDAARNETFNLTCGNARSLMELARLVQRAFPGTVIEHTARDPLRPRRGTLSVEKARGLLGYSPKVQLEEGLQRCIAVLDADHLGRSGGGSRSGTAGGAVLEERVLARVARPAVVEQGHPAMHAEV